MNTQTEYTTLSKKMLCYFDEGRILFIAMTDVVMLKVVMLSVVMSVVMLKVVILKVVMLSVVTPLTYLVILALSKSVVYIFSLLHD